MTSMNIPEPVMSLAIMPKTREASGGFSKALSRFQKEDPTFKVHRLSPPPGSNETAAHECPMTCACLYSPIGMSTEKAYARWLQVSSDPETGQTIISGMGELHLEIYVERMNREYNVSPHLRAAPWDQQGMGGRVLTVNIV